MIGRLLRRADFLRVAASKQKWVAPGLILQVSPPAASVSPDQESARVRVGFTASRKVGNSVRRNRAKRRLRAAARDVLAAIKVAPCDLVLIARPQTVERDYALLIQDLTAGLKRWRLIENGSSG